MSVSITGLARNIQFIISGNTTLVPKYLTTIYTSSTQVGVVYYLNKFDSTQEILQFNYGSVTSQTFSNSYQAAEYVQQLIDEDQQYTNSHITFSGITATTLSGGTIFSGSTDLSSLFITVGQLTNVQTFVQPGLNTYTGGTSLRPTVNVSALTINTLSASGNSIVNANFSANTIFSGSTPLQTIITSLIPSPLFSGTTAGGIKQIYPINNNIANNIYSITFGSNNKTYTQYSTILNGLSNIISTNTVNLYHNAILGGKQNTVYNSKYSLIGAGVQNYISGYYSAILVGSDNRIYNSPDHAFVFGNNNKTDSLHSFVFGYINLITGVTNSSILGGRNNKIHKNIYGTFSYNIVANSLQSTILNSNFSNLASGSGNTISSANFSSIINGQSNKTYSSFSTVVGGKLNTAKTEYSIILGGSGNTALGISSIILGGFNNKNTTLSSSYSTIINGVDNVISSCPAGFGSNKTTKFGTVINGSNNHVMYNYATIINGSNNHGNGLYNLIGNGQYNRTNLSHVPQTATTVLNGIDNTAIHNYATIINGIDNFVETTFGFIGNGNFNQIPSQGYYGTILNGKRNNVQGGHFNQILNGDYSLIAGTNIRHNTIINGSGHRISNNVSGTTILGGVGLTATTSNTAYGDFAQFRSLTGGTTQMVVANVNGLLGVQTIPSAGQSTIVRDGLNTYTAGTAADYSVNVSALTVDNLSVSASTDLNILSATTLQVRNLSGVTTRMVVANTSGVLSSQAIPAVYTQYWTVGSVASSLIQNNGYTSTNSDYSIVAGKLNSIGTNSNYSNILGGIENQNIDNNKYSAIVNGIQNQIKDYSNHAFIGTGRGGYIYNSNNSSILNGYGNRIYNSASNSESKYNTILGGYQNKIIRATHSTVLGGFLSSIGTGDALYQYSCVFGKQNYVNANYSAIIGGQGYSLTENNTLLTPKLKIGNLPSTSSTYLLNANSYGNVYKIGMSGGTGININNTDGLLTITYTGSTSSGGGATVNNGLNTYTAGTSTFQSVNVSGLTIDNINVSGSSTFNSLSASSVQISNLVSTGNTKMVVADINGNLSANTIPFNILNYKQSTLPSNGAKRYYRTSPILGGIANGTFAQHSIVLAPFYIGKNCDINELQLQVTTTGGTGVYSLAIYDNYTPGGLHPGNLKQSFGSGLTSPTGVKVLTASTVTYYEAGMYWLALWNSTSFAISVSSNNNIDIGTTNSNFTNTSTFVSAATWSNSFPANMTGVTSTGTVTPLLNYHMKTIYN